jgi:heme/copper-type cytochrome/quinol oxidase subunit 1
VTPPPTVAPARPEIVTRRIKPSRQAWIERATSADHKAVGTLYIGTALTFLALAVTEFVLMRAQLIVPENTLIKPEVFDRLMTAAPVTFVVLSCIPLLLGLIVYVVPLQLGARGVALPRLNQLSYWLYAAGAVTIYASFLYTVPETGTAALPPLSNLTFSPSNGADAWIAGTALVTLGFVFFAINMIVTIRNLRAPGIAWRRMPVFAFSSAVISWLMVVVGPIMIAALTMLEIDRRFDGIFFEPGEGGAPVLYQHLSYIFLTGAYLTVFIGAAGAISEILPTFARKPLFSRRAALACLAVVAVLGTLAWMQNMYTAPLNSGWTIAAMALALALVVPIGLLIYNWIATIWGGTLQLRAASWYALLAISTMACGLAGELGYSVIPVGWALDYTTASQGDTLYVLVGGGLMGGFAGLHYWFPKMSGRLLGEGLGKAALVLMAIGVHLYVIPMFLAGLEGQPVDVWQFYEDTGVDGYNLIASIGVFVLALGILLQLGNAARSWNHGLPARGHDPWGGATLEWFALSPPPPHNFDAVPDVRSGEPLYDIRESIARRERSFAAPVARVPAPAAAVVSEAGETADTGRSGAPERRPGGDRGDGDDGEERPVA